MIKSKAYSKSFILAVLLHFLLAVLLLVEFSSSRPVLTKEVESQTGDLQAKEDKPKQEIVKAVSVDSQELMKAVENLKAERTKKVQAEQARQTKLMKQAEAAKQERLKEQERLTQLKEESEKLALKRKQELAEEQKRLKLLSQEKEKETKHLAELKKQQQVLEKKQAEEKTLAELRKKQEAEKEAKAKVEQQKAEQAKAEALENSQRQARLAGEVDKYKALIINAISRRWILPENVDSSLSSQFKIRLAPDGAVLEVSLLRSSGDPILDRSAQTAIYKASPLPVPTDPTTFDLFREISLTVRPENIRG